MIVAPASASFNPSSRRSSPRGLIHSGSNRLLILVSIRLHVGVAHEERANSPMHSCIYFMVSIRLHVGVAHEGRPGHRAGAPRRGVSIRLHVGVAHEGLYVVGVAQHAGLSFNPSSRRSSPRGPATPSPPSTPGGFNPSSRRSSPRGPPALPPSTVAASFNPSSRRSSPRGYARRVVCLPN